MTTEDLLKELSEVGLGVTASDHMSEVERANICSMTIKALSAEVEALHEFMKEWEGCVHVKEEDYHKEAAERDALKARLDRLELLASDAIKWGVNGDGYDSSVAIATKQSLKAALAQAGSALTCASCDNREPKDGFCSVWSKSVDPSHGKQCTAHSIIAKPAAQNGGATA